VCVCVCQCHQTRLNFEINNSIRIKVLYCTVTISLPEFPSVSMPFNSHDLGDSVINSSRCLDLLSMLTLAYIRACCSVALLLCTLNSNSLARKAFNRILLSLLVLGIGVISYLNGKTLT